MVNNGRQISGSTPGFPPTFLFHISQTSILLSHLSQLFLPLARRLKSNSIPQEDQAAPSAEASNAILSCARPSIRLLTSRPSIFASYTHGIVANTSIVQYKGAVPTSVATCNRGVSFYHVQRIQVNNNQTPRTETIGTNTPDLLTYQPAKPTNTIRYHNKKQTSLTALFLLLRLVRFRERLNSS